MFFFPAGKILEDAMHNLDKIARIYQSDDPWKISFSYSRALQEEANESWAGKDDNMDEAQAVFLCQS